MNRVFLILTLLAMVVGLGVVHFSLVGAAPGLTPLAEHIDGTPHTPIPTPTNTPTPPPDASFSPRSGQVGSQVRVNGSWFSPGTVVITFQSQQVATASPGFNGAFSTSFDVPALTAGRYRVRVGALSLGDYTITSSFSITPTSGRPGTSVTVRGSGYGPNAEVSITFDNQEISNASADQNGRILVTVEVPPGAAGGNHEIAASGPSSTDQATFSVSATLSLDRTEASPGATVTVSGTGFRANETGISIKFDNRTQKSGITADFQGVWTESFTVPNATAGSHTIKASGLLTPESKVPSVRLTLGAGLSLERTSGPPGITVRANGSGAGSGERITVIVGNNLERIEVVASSSGVWSADITIPAAPGGRLSIVASGTTSRATETSFTITPLITLAEPKGFPGSKLTLKGDGFQANQIGIPITFADSIIGSASADQQGSWTAELIIPSAAAGTYGLRVSSANGVQQLPFTITPGISMSKSRSGPGETVTINGSGFVANEREISVSLGEIIVGSGISANADGSWGHTFKIPQLPAGPYIVSASGSSTSAANVSDALFTLASQVTLSATSGTPGVTVNITGRGFGANERSIAITFDGTVVVSGIVADRSGSFTTSFEVPPSSAGDHSILVGSDAVGGVTGSAEIGFQVRPDIKLEYVEGPPGHPIIVTGSGFGANEAGISIEYDDVIMVSQITADVVGSFQESFLVPPSAAGTHDIRARSPLGSGTDSPDQAFTVTPRLDLSEDAGSVALKLEVTGDGYQPGSTITLTYDDLTRATVTADDQGSFRLEFVVPESLKGEREIKVLDDQGNQVLTTFTLEDTPPEAPALRSPVDGDRGGLLGGFQPETEWSAVEDASGVRYILQIAKDSDPEFLAPVLEKVALESPRYALTEEEALSRGKYIWRVRAVDKAANEGPWSNTYTVQSGIIPIWVILFLVVLGLLASGGGAYAFMNNRRRRAQEEAVIPEFVRILQPEAAPAIGAPTAAAALTAPPRRALPSPFRRGRGLSPEEQARLRLVVDFVRSIPLIGVSTDMVWLEELVEMIGGTKEEVYQQVLEGQIDLVYQPAWLQHPTYEELRVIPQALSFLQALEAYIGAVNDCAADTVALLRRLHSEISTAGPLDTPYANQWRFALTVGLSTIAWFRGAYLGQPSAREYIIVPMPETESWEADEETRVSLYGEESTPFSGVILEGLTEEDAIFYRDLHIQLRVRYRNQEEARGLAAKLTATDTMREQLTQGMEQMGELAQRN